LAQAAVSSRSTESAVAMGHIVHSWNTMSRVKSVEVAAIWFVIQTIAAGQLHGASTDTGSCATSNAESMAMMQMAVNHTPVKSKKLYQRSPAQRPAVPTPQLSQVEMSRTPTYIKDPTGGWCTPWGSVGDLCNPSTPGNHNVACAGVDSAYYFPTGCDMQCAEDKCDADDDCFGVTYRKSDGKYKAKSMVEAVHSNSGYSCYRKPPTLNYLPIDFITNQDGGDHCPGSDGEIEFRFDIGNKWDASFGACAKPCNTDSDCPSPPAGTTAVCDYFYKKCFVACTKDSDCQSSAICAYNEICTYRMSSTMRSQSPETHYGYPVYDRVTAQAPEDACFGNGVRVWYSMGGLYVVCSPPCTTTSDCPVEVAPGARTTPVCIDVGHGYGSGCYIPCSGNRDCQHGSVCLLNHNPSRCVFPI